MKLLIINIHMKNSGAVQTVGRLFFQLIQFNTERSSSTHKVEAVSVRFRVQLGLRQTQALIIIYTMDFTT